MICFRVNRVIPFLLLALFAGISLGSFAQSTIVLETKDKTVQAVKNSFPNFEVSRDGKLIAVTSSVSRIGENRVGGILIFNTVIFKLLRVLRGHETVIINMKFSPDGSKLLASEFNKNVVLWDVKTGKVIKKIALGKAALFFDINSRDQALFANFGRSISLYDLNTGQQIHNFKLKSSFVTNLLFTDDDKAKIVILGTGDR